MKNKGLKITGGIVITLAIIFFAVTLSLDGYVKSGIEENGSDLLQTEVNVDDVDISIFGGTGEIQGFTVQNPDGFSDNAAIRFDQVDWKVDIRSLFSDTIRVKEMIVKSPELYFEQKGIGANLKKLNDNMAASGSSESGQASLVIEYLRMENANVKVHTNIDKERDAQASLSTFELEDIGKNGSNTVEQSIHEVMEPLLERAVAEAVKGGILQQLEDKAQDLLGGK